MIIILIIIPTIKIIIITLIMKILKVFIHGRYEKMKIRNAYLINFKRRYRKMQVGIIIYHETRISPLSTQLMDHGKGENLIGDHSFEYEW